MLILKFYKVKLSRYLIRLTINLTLDAVISDIVTVPLY